MSRAGKNLGLLNIAAIKQCAKEQLHTEYEFLSPIKRAKLDRANNSARLPNKENFSPMKAPNKPNEKKDERAKSGHCLKIRRKLVEKVEEPAQQPISQFFKLIPTQKQ